jgi:uncharacterized protein (TIGR03435 family)
MTNAIRFLGAQPWVEDLGWTLLYFLWQGALIAAVYEAVRRRLRRPAARYALACAAIAAMIAAPVLTAISLQPAAAAIDPAYRIHSTPPAIAPAAPLPDAVRIAVSGARHSDFLPWIVIAWAAGAIVLWIRLLGGWLVASRMRSMLVRPAPAEWRDRMRALAARLGVTRPVRLLVSALVHVPTVVGWLRPVVLVPVGALAGLPAEHMEALLAHELAHIRRHDYLVNLLQTIAEALLFYHPAVWWISGHIRTERELCCDDAAVAITGDMFVYAQALAELESCRPAYLAPMIAANGGSLPDRVARLLGYPTTPASHTGGGLLAAGALLLAATYGVFAQTTERPAFQAASIKPNTGANPRGRIVRPQPGGRLVTENAPLVMLMQNAYSVQAFQIVGGPAWVNTDGWDIEAKPEGNTDREHMWLMLQTLLADRFKLALHRDTRELPVYAITAAKGGLKLAAPKDGACSAIEPTSMLPPQGTIPCGRVVVSMSPEGLRLDGGKVPMPELARMLAAVMGRPVIDQTGFTSLFDIHLTGFTPDETMMGLPGAGGPREAGGPRPPSDNEKPGIAAALQEQAGLKLGPSKGSVEVLVIDRVERPTAN